MQENIKKIVKLISKEQWANARIVIVKELRATPSDHWLLTRLSTTYYEEHLYSKAKKVCERALAIAPGCPLALWDYAGILDMLDREDEAIEIWKRLIKKGVQKVANGHCGEGIRWAKELLNDCRYRLALAYTRKNMIKIASIYLRIYLKKRSYGVKSIYCMANVRQLEQELRNIGGV